MSSKTRDEIDYKIFSESYPLCNNPLTIILGGTGSGKSYFAYKVLGPLYTKLFEIKHLLIANNTGSLDRTLSSSIKGIKKVNPKMRVKFLTIPDAFKEAQAIRGEVVIQDMLNDILRATSPDGVHKVVEKWKEKAKRMDSYPFMASALSKYISDFDDMCNFDNYDLQRSESDSDMEDDRSDDEVMDCVIDKVHHHCRQLISKAGPYQGEQPILLIVDDQANSHQLSSKTSEFTKMMLVRRHLHLGCFVLTQTITGINTDLRRNATNYILLPGVSSTDLKLLQSRLPYTTSFEELQEMYRKISEMALSGEGERSDQIISIFNYNPYYKVVLGRPAVFRQFYKLI